MGFQTQTKKTNTPRFARSYWNDPKAMDMDRLTTEEQERHFKETDAIIVTR